MSGEDLKPGWLAADVAKAAARVEEWRRDEPSALPLQASCVELMEELERAYDDPNGDLAETAFSVLMRYKASKGSPHA